MINITKLSIVLCAIGFCFSLKAQKTTYIIKDTITGKVISNVHIYDNKNEIIGFTDYNGRFTKNISKYDTIQFSHIGYLEKKITVNKLLNNTTIKLKPSIIQLDEIILNKKNNKIFKAYFRGWQILENNLKYYVDGICEYKINLEKQIERNIIQYRFLKNDSLLNSRKKRFIQIEIGFVLPKLITRKELEKSLFYFDIDSTNSKKNIPIKMLGKQTGKYSLNKYGELIDYEYNQYQDSSYVSKKLGYRQKILYEYYRNNFKNFGSIMFNSFQKKYTLKKIKHKKDTNFDRVSTTFEIFIIDGVIKETEKKIKRYKTDRSYFKNEYWHKYEEKFPQQKIIKDNINKLTKMKNKYKSP